MRTDKALGPEIRRARSWNNVRYDKDVLASAKNRLSAAFGESFSGNERNKLFVSRQARQFVDLSAVSGVDNIADGRVLSLCDFDRDGWQDMVNVNANAPLLNIYRNNLGAEPLARQNGRMIAIRFVGGSRSAVPNKRYGSRDGFGAKVRIAAGKMNLIRELRCGEGMAGQNSKTMLVGIGKNEMAQTVTVRWLSGIKQRFHNVAAGTLLTVYENPEHSPNKSDAVRTPYVVNSNRRWYQPHPGKTPALPANRTLLLTGSANGETQGSGTPKLKLYTTMATWCESCRRHLPEIQQMSRSFPAGALAIYGVPVDDGDDATKLTSYAERYQPAYHLLKDLAVAKRDKARQLVAEVLNSDALPATIVTDADGTVLQVTPGLPTVSQIRRLMARQAGRP